MSSDKIIYHKHHLVPRHSGGIDECSNIIKVNIALHAFLHKLLWEEHKNIKDKVAWLGLSKQIEKSEVLLLLVSQPKTEEHKNKISISKKGKESSFKGKTHSNESKEKMKNAKKGYVPWNKGKTGVQIAWNKGMKMDPHKEETKQKISDATIRQWNKRKELI